MTIFERSRAELSAHDQIFARGVVANEQKARDLVQTLDVSYTLELKPPGIVLWATVSTWPGEHARSMIRFHGVAGEPVGDKDWTSIRQPLRAFERQERVLHGRGGTIAARDADKRRMKRFLDRFRIAVDECLALP